MAEIPRQSTEEEKKFGVDDAKEYFSNMPDFNDDPDLTAIIGNASKENFFDKVTTKNGKKVSAFDLVVRDEAEYRRAEEEYGREGKQDKEKQYKERADYAAKVAEFLQNLAIERRQNKLGKADAGRIIAAINSDLAEESADKEKEVAPEAAVTQSVDAGIDPSQIERLKPSEEIPPYGTFVKKGEPIQHDTLEATVENEKTDKKEREYDKLGRQLEEFKALWTDGKEKEAIDLATEMSAGKEVADKKEAKEIYKKKLGLFNTATKIIKSKEIRQQLKKIADTARESGEYKKGDKLIKLKKEDKIDGRLFFRNDKYYFEFGGKLFLVEQKKLANKKGRPPSPAAPADALQVDAEPPPLPQEVQQEPPPLPETEQNQATSEANSESDVKPLPPDDIRNAKLNFGIDRAGKVIVPEQNPTPTTEESGRVEFDGPKEQEDAKPSDGKGFESIQLEEIEETKNERRKAVEEFLRGGLEYFADKVKELREQGVTGEELGNWEYALEQRQFALSDFEKGNIGLAEREITDQIKVAETQRAEAIFEGNEKNVEICNNTMEEWDAVYKALTGEAVFTLRPSPEENYLFGLKPALQEVLGDSAREIKLQDAKKFAAALRANGFSTEQLAKIQKPKKYFWREQMVSWGNNTTSLSKFRKIFEESQKN